MKPGADRQTARLELGDDSMCFCCGEENPQGLHMRFEDEDGGVSTRVSFPKHLQGYRDIVHGGLLSTALDETMITLLNRMGFLAVTGELHVRFLSPLHVGQTVEIHARLVESRGRVFKVAASASLPDGTEIAKAESTCLSMGRVPKRTP